MTDSSSVLGRIEKIEEKITSLNNRVSPRQKKDISETLKSSLRNCFDQITKLLKDIETIEEAEAKSFIYQKKENLMRKKMSLEKFLKESGFLGMIFDSCSDGPDGQKKLSGEKINNLFDDEGNTNKNPNKSWGKGGPNKSWGRGKASDMELKAAFSGIFDPLKKIGVKQNLFKKLETIDTSSTSSSSSESKSESDSKDDDLSNELKGESSSSDSSFDSLKDAINNIDTKKIKIVETKVEPKKMKKDESLDSLLKKVTKIKRKIRTTF